MTENETVWFINLTLIGAMVVGAAVFALIPRYRMYPLSVRAFVGMAAGLSTLIGWCLFLSFIYGFRPP